MAVNLVTVEGVSKIFGTRAVLDGVSVGVSEGDRIGVVGRNGDGKTTLTQIMAKREEPDGGRVTQVTGLRIGVLAQGGAPDPEAGFAGSLGDLVRDPRLNHRVEVTAGVLEAECGEVLRAFFAERR